MSDRPTTSSGRQRSRRPALARTVAALVLAAFVLGGARSLAQPNANELKPFRYDFRGRKVNDEILEYQPPSAREAMTEAPQGLVIRSPGKDGKAIPIGLAPRFPVEGDCEITVSYELLKADRPVKGYGTGVSLYIMTPSKEAVMVANFYHPREGHVHSSHRNGHSATGKRQYHSDFFPTDARAGRLRLVRRGDFVSCQAANGNDVFRELKQYHLGNEDLRLVRVAADTGDSAFPVEVRIHEFEIRPLAVPLAAPAVDPPETPAEEKGGGRWAILLGVAAAVALAAGLAVWLYRRQNRRAGRPAEAHFEAEALGEAESATAVVAFTCGDCGKRLKARADLAGKKVRCGQCGKAVLVPAAGADEASRFFT